MRLLAFCDYYSPHSCGGAERVAREIYRRLVTDHGVDVTVVGTGSGADSYDRIDPQGIREVFVPGRDLSKPLGVQLCVASDLRAVIGRLERTWRPTVLHANSLHFHSTVLAARLTRRSGVPLVTTAHLGSVKALPTRLRLGAQAWDSSLGRFVVRRSSKLVAVSQSVATYLQQLGAEPDKVSVAPNGVDHDAFHPDGRTARRGPLRVGFVGRLIANKGPDVLLEAVALAGCLGADLQVVIIGDGPMRPALTARSAKPDLVDRVRFTGQVDDVATLLRSVDVVVRPSYTEGLPLAVIEAMACGAVVVSSDVAGNLELVTDSENGLVFPAGDAPALAAALARLAGDPQLLAGLADKAISRAADFSWDTSTRLHLLALQQAQRQGARNGG